MNFSNAIYNVVGVIAMTQTKFKELVEDLIQNNQYTEDEGKRIVDEFSFAITNKTENIKTTIFFNIENYLEKLNVPKIDNVKLEFENILEKVKINPISLWYDFNNKK